MDAEPGDPKVAKRILTESTVVAILGAHHDLSRAAGYVPQYLFEQGYEIHPVNPALVGTELFGRPVVATLADLRLGGRSLDLVDVFRRADVIPSHLADLLGAKPRAVWFQLGIRNDPAARTLKAAGIEVVQDRCTLADHMAFGVGRPKKRR